MQWDKYTIETTTEAEDFISMVLQEVGIDGIEIENHQGLTDTEKAVMFGDVPPEAEVDDGSSKVSFYLEANEDHSEILKEVRIALEGVKDMVSDPGSLKITSDVTKDIDWINNWKQFFSSFTVGDFFIKPTWEELKEEDKEKILIEIDPGISFGTGKHETTQLCIKQLDKYLKGGEKVLDIGCGSGILSIAALKLQAKKVVGVDIDPDCMISTKSNLETNHLEDADISLYTGNIIEDASLREELGKDFDVVAANLLAEILIPMAGIMYDYLKPGGKLITSGIIDFKEAQVEEVFKNAGFKILETNIQGEWANITAEKE